MMKLCPDCHVPLLFISKTSNKQSGLTYEHRQCSQCGGKMQYIYNTGDVEPSRVVWRNGGGFIAPLNLHKVTPNDE